ncbi:MAG: hypothetical protein ACTSRP_11595 [Candidatus Helarchaeota archaeon]
MEIGRGKALSILLNNLSNELNAAACLLVDERGLLISEYLKSNLDKKAMAIMSSLLNGTGNKFINSLKIKKLTLITIKTSEGLFLIKEVPIVEKNRKFILCVYIENKNSNNKSYFNNIFSLSKNIFTTLINTLFFSRFSNNHSKYDKQLDFAIREIQNLFLS